MFGLFKNKPYIGEYKDGLYHGQGTYTFDNGDKYEGDWKDGKQNGKGIYIWGKVSSEKWGGGWKKYVGEWKDNMSDGRGTVTYQHGETILEGEWKDDKQHGRGTNIFKATKVDEMDETYEGEFYSGHQHGQGICTYHDGSTYVGEWKVNKKNGQGTMTFPDGSDTSKFEGEWKNDMLWNGKKFDLKGELISFVENGKEVSKEEIDRKKESEKEKIKKEQEYIQNKIDFFKENELIFLPKGDKGGLEYPKLFIRDENFEEYELEEERGDFIVYKPEGLRGKRAYIKTDGENYLAWSGPIKIADKSKFLRGDFEKAKEEVKSSQGTAINEKEDENIEPPQEETEINDATEDIGAKLEKLTKLYEEGILTKEEFQKKSDALISQI